MKAKFIVSALSCFLLGNAHAELYDHNQKHRTTMPEVKNTNNSEKVTITKEEYEQYLWDDYHKDPKRFFTGDLYENFKGLPDSIKNLLGTRALNLNDPNPDRFNRDIVEIRLNSTELEEKTRYLEKLLDECVELVGRTPDDHWQYVNLAYGNYPLSIMHGTDELFSYITPSYLFGRMQKCTTYLYSKNYDLGDFEYAMPADLSQSERDEKALIEQKYAVIYLRVKEAGLLRRMFYAYYPKSLLREYADQAGLTTFIHSEEKKAGKSLKHYELAIQFFGSKKEWLKGFYQFLDTKILTHTY